MPRGFRGVAPAGLLQDLWLPIDAAGSGALLNDRAATLFEIFARLKPGRDHQQAESALRVLGRQLRADHPDIPESFVQMEALPVDGIGAFRGMADLIIPVLGFLTLMAFVAGLILLIGCANIAGLLMGRAAARRKEIAMRLALGAGRGRLVRQLLTESLVLAVAGGAAGMLLAIWLTNGVNPFLSRSPVPMEFDLHLDNRVLAYVLAASVVSAVLSRSRARAAGIADRSAVVVEGRIRGWLRPAAASPRAGRRPGRGLQRAPHLERPLPAQPRRDRQHQSRASTPTASSWPASRSTT